MYENNTGPLLEFMKFKQLTKTVKQCEDGIYFIQGPNVTVFLSFVEDQALKYEVAFYEHKKRLFKRILKKTASVVLSERARADELWQVLNSNTS